MTNDPGEGFIERIAEGFIVVGFNQGFQLEKRLFEIGVNLPVFFQLGIADLRHEQLFMQEMLIHITGKRFVENLPGFVFFCLRQSRCSSHSINPPARCVHHPPRISRGGIPHQNQTFSWSTTNLHNLNIYDWKSFSTRQSVSS